MLAVLQDALTTFQRGLHSTVREDIEKFREVDRWLRSRDYDGIFSFECICCTLGIDPGCLRAGLNEARETAFLKRRGITVRNASRERIHARRAWRGRVG